MADEVKSNVIEGRASTEADTADCGDATLRLDSAGGRTTSSDLDTRETNDSFLRDVAALPIGLPRQLQADRSGERLGHYALRGQLGRGGMGVVYLAEDVRLRRRVALKVLREEVAGDAERRERFLREARSASAVHHHNIATVFDVGQSGETLYLAMEYVEGRTLRAVLDESGGKLDVGEAVRLGVQIARALACAHEVGIVHRDIKPENVMVRTDGVVKVLDFGIAKMSADARPSSTEEPNVPPSSDFASRAGQVMGTPGYMSPEQCTSSPVDARTDVFSVGMVLIEMLSGMRPLRATAPAGELAHQHAPLRLARVLERSVRPAAVDRFASCADLLRELEDAETALAAAARWRPWRLPLAVGGLVLCTGGVALALRSSTPTNGLVEPSATGMADASAAARELPSASHGTVGPVALPEAVAEESPTRQPQPSVTPEPLPTHTSGAARSAKPRATRNARVSALATNNLYSVESLRAATGATLGVVSGCFSLPDPAVEKTTFNVYQVRVNADGTVTSASAAADPVPALDGCVSRALRRMHLGPTLTGVAGEVSVTFAAR